MLSEPWLEEISAGDLACVDGLSEDNGVGVIAPVGPEEMPGALFGGKVDGVCGGVAAKGDASGDAT